MTSKCLQTKLLYGWRLLSVRVEVIRLPLLLANNALKRNNLINLLLPLFTLLRHRFTYALWFKKFRFYKYFNTFCIIFYRLLSYKLLTRAIRSSISVNQSSDWSVKKKRFCNNRCVLHYLWFVVTVHCLLSSVTNDSPE